MTWRESPHASWICAVVLGGAALLNACAKGDTVDTESVGLFPLPEASVRPDAGIGGKKGSGGSGSGGAPGSGGTSSGGAQMMGKGGSGAGGRATGGTGEDGGTGMGGKASGGAPAMGGSGSGGRATGGASGGGGTSTGGSAGKSTGGTMSGGSAGAAGSGTGGAMQCPNYPTNDDCSKCICSKCKSDVALCFASGDATKDGQCKAIQVCAEMNHCAGTSCYCGNAFLCTPPNGPCLQSINAAAGGNPTPTQVNMYAGDTNHPIGRANAIGTCSTNNCRTECGL